jgi:hypothetical protein
LIELLVGERLAQESGSARSHRSLTGIYALVGGDENDRNAAARGSQVVLKLQSIHARHLHVNDETRGIVQVTGTQERFGGFISRRAKAKGLDEERGGSANRPIVVNYRDQILYHPEALTGVNIFAERVGIYWALVDPGRKKDDLGKLSLTRLFPRGL